MIDKYQKEDFNKGLVRKLNSRLYRMYLDSKDITYFINKNQLKYPKDENNDILVHRYLDNIEEQIKFIRKKLK